MAIGGDDTLSIAQKLQDKGVKVVGVPKTIDNDLGGTDYTFGFDTACNVVCEAIDRVHTTAEAHNRVMVVEVMGRDAGWIALYSGIAGGADVILIPERPFDAGQGSGIDSAAARTPESIFPSWSWPRGQSLQPKRMALLSCRTWARTNLAMPSWAGLRRCSGAGNRETHLV